MWRQLRQLKGLGRRRQGKRTMFSSCEDCVVVNPKAAMIEGSQNDKPYVPMF